MTTNQEIIDAIRVPNPELAIALPPGVKLVPHEALDTEPSAPRGRVRLESLESLVAYAIRHKIPGTTVFASGDAMRISLALDWHETTSAPNSFGGWGEHSAAYELSYTPEWLAWTGISGRPLGQTQFAEFIEEHLDCIHAPAAADILTVATTLSGKRNIEFTNQVTLANGDKSLQWQEKTEAKAAGDIRVPSEIILRIPILKGSEKETTFDVRTLFRYRIDGGRLSFEVKLLHVDKIGELAFKQVVDSLTKKLTEHQVPVLTGNIVKTPRETFESTIIKN